MLRLQTFGGLVLLDSAGTAVATQRRRLALLALLGVAGERGLTRDKLVAYLWPESSADHARHALEQLLYELRRQVSDKLFLGTDPVALNPELVESDVGQFETALARGAAADAVAYYRGAFLDGFYLRGAEEFERWTESERSRLAASCRRALETLARADAARKQYASEVEWRRRIAALDPLGTQGALDLMHALVAAGDRAGALQYARVYETLMRQELSSDPDPAVTELARQLKQSADAPEAEPAAQLPSRSPSDLERSADSIRRRETPRQTTAPRRSVWRRVLLVVASVILAGAGVSAVLTRQHPPAPMSTSPRTLAVLPCRNLSSSQDDEYFSDGMTLELITALGRIKALQVAARTSAFTFRNRNVSAQDIGQQLHVGALLECAVRRSGDRLRVTASLVTTSDGYQVWSDEYDRHYRDVFVIQDEIARAVARALQVTLHSADTLSTRRLTRSDSAHDLYLRGRSFFAMRTDERTLRKSIEYFEQAIRLDSSYAAAYSGLSEAYGVLSIWGFTRPRQGFDSAKVAALRALALDSTLAEAHTSLAIVSMWYDLDGATAERELNRAIALDSGYAPARLFHAWYLRSHGYADSAIKEARLARELDPLSLIANIRVGSMLFYSGKYEEARAELESALELDTTNAMAHAELARVFVQLHRCPEALATIYKLPASFQNVERGVEGYVYATCGHRPEAQTMLQDLQRRWRRGFVFASRIAVLEVGLHHYDDALGWLDSAIVQRDPMSQALAIEPLYAPLRSDPRFERLLAKAGLQ